MKVASKLSELPIKNVAQWPNGRPFKVMWTPLRQPSQTLRARQKSTPGMLKPISDNASVTQEGVALQSQPFRLKLDAQWDDIQPVQVREADRLRLGCQRVLTRYCRHQRRLWLNRHPSAVPAEPQQWTGTSSLRPTVTRRAARRLSS